LPEARRLSARITLRRWVKLAAVNPIGNTAPDAYRVQKPAKGFSLTAEDFLKLLAAQLRYQNPLEPMNNTQFVAQLTQFAMLQELITLRNGLEKAKEGLEELEKTLTEEQALRRALSLVGMEVEVSAGGLPLAGVVSGVRLANGVPFLVVDGRMVDLSQVVEVRRPEKAEPQEG
jgi:flagellar basal-body rod modification protein FlgD